MKRLWGSGLLEKNGGKDLCKSSLVLGEVNRLLKRHFLGESLV